MQKTQFPYSKQAKTKTKSNGSAGNRNEKKI